MEYYRLTDWVLLQDEDFNIITSWTNHFRSIGEEYAVYEKNDYSNGTKKKSQALFVVGFELGEYGYIEDKEKIFYNFKLVNGIEMRTNDNIQ